MKIYDISRELLSSRVYPGDPTPKLRVLSSIDEGNLYNLTAINMSVHCGTHIDAPLHFISGGESICEMDLSLTVGPACVIIHNGIMDKTAALTVIEKAKEYGKDASKRILIKGNSTVSEEAAIELGDSGIMLLGVESMSVGPINAPMAAHIALLSKKVAILENLNLDEVEEGEYFLSAAPIKIEGAEGSPCRAILIKQ